MKPEVDGGHEEFAESRIGLGCNYSVEYTGFRYDQGYTAIALDHLKRKADFQLGSDK